MLLGICSALYTSRSGISKQFGGFWNSLSGFRYSEVAFERTQCINKKLKRCSPVFLLSEYSKDQEMSHFQEDSLEQKDVKKFSKISKSSQGDPGGLQLKVYTNLSYYFAIIEGI